MPALRILAALLTAIGMLSPSLAEIIIGFDSPQIPLPGAGSRISLPLGVLRQRVFAVAEGYMPQFEAGQAVSFNLFDGEVAHGQVSDVVQRGGGSGSWLGPVLSLSGDGAAPTATVAASGSFILSVLGDSWMGNVRLDNSPNHQYEIRPYAEGFPHLFTLSLIDVSARYDFGEGEGDALSGSGRRMMRGVADSAESDGRRAGRRLSASGGHQPDSDDILDVGVLWTPEAQAAAGGAAGMTNLVNLAIDESNAILKNSDVSLRVRLASARLVADPAYVEPSEDAFPTMFWNLVEQDDGVFDVDTGKRYTEGADVTVLLVDDGSYCGVGGQLSVANYYEGRDAYAVVARGCATGFYSFLHEIGHIVGANHDFSDGWYSYSSGYCWLGPGGGCSGCGRSVMAYGSCKTDASTSGGQCNWCSRKAYLSNPDVLVDGYATGTVAENNNALTTNLTRFIAMTWANTTFSGGVIYSVAPSSVPAGAATAISIKGWRLSHGDRVDSVTLDGVSAIVVSQTADSVEVLSSGLNANSGGLYTPVVVTTTGGRVTSLDAIVFTGTSRPTGTPSAHPSLLPTTASPSHVPTLMPSFSPTTMNPTSRPSTAQPTVSPTPAPSTASPSTFLAGIFAFFDAEVIVENISSSVCESYLFDGAFKAAVVEAVAPDALAEENIFLLSCEPTEVFRSSSRRGLDRTGLNLAVSFRVKVFSQHGIHLVKKMTELQEKLRNSVSSSIFSSLLTDVATQVNYIHPGDLFVVLSGSFFSSPVQSYPHSTAPTTVPAVESGGAQGDLISGKFLFLAIICCGSCCFLGCFIGAYLVARRFMPKPGQKNQVEGMTIGVETVREEGFSADLGEVQVEAR